MLRPGLLLLATAFLCGGPVVAGRSQPTGQAATRISTAVACAFDLGTGAETRRRFCDVVIAPTGTGSITVAIPPRVGPATLMVDLHNRFVVPAGAAPPGGAYVRQTALVAVVTEDGGVIDRAVVSGEFRTVQDAFDRITGGGQPGGVKAVAPGRVESARFTIPAGLDEVGIVGVRLELLGGGRTEADVFETPGRPIAIVSNLRVEYTPR